MKQDSNIRSIAKTLSWRFIATTATALLVVVFTGNLKAAFVIGGSEAIGKMFLYFFHERVWNRITWGKISSQHKVIAVIEDQVDSKSIVPEIKKMLIKLQKPTVILDKDNAELLSSKLTLNWIKQISFHSIYPIFVFKEWNQQIDQFLRQMETDVIVVSNTPQLVGESYRVMDFSGITMRSLKHQLSSG